MKIKKLIMHNFGVYALTNILELKGNKPIVLIGGDERPPKNNYS